MAGLCVCGAAFRKCCNPWDWQVVPADLVGWQQLCAGWCAAAASSICGQERQFPQNNATTISAAISELQTLCIVT
jgi:Tfp pilus assembly protein PilV